MICPKCGTENPAKFKFCVGCGCNLEDPSEVNIEQVDMGGYRSEEDYDSDKNGFKIGSGTFTISDSAPDTSSAMFTADELNDTDEEFDFSSFDEPYIPKLDADRLTVPGVGGSPQNPQQPQMAQNMRQFPQQPQGMPQQNMFGGFPQQSMMGAPGQPAAGMQSSQQPAPNQQNGAAPQGMPGQQPMGMNPYMNQMYGGQPQMMYGQPQIIGYDQNGMPIYGQTQPMMYGQPQIIGYDQNGMPIYSQAQPMMYGQPQIIGYDQNGMPIYGQAQPMMYGQPQMMGENGEPVSQQNPYQMPQQGMPPYGMPAPPMGMPGQPMNGMYGAPPQMQQHQQPQAQKPADDKVKVPNKFWNDFFSDGDGGSDGKNSGDQDDFFGKSRSGDMGSVSAEGMDLSRLKKHERKKNSYMTDTPSVNADALQPNKKDDINKLYMRKTAMVNAEDLKVKKTEKTQDIMGVTNDVNADDLATYEHKKTRVVMVNAEQADAEQLEVYKHEHQESIMAEADHAVEALPKKKVIVDEIDAIELPEHMQAKKTVKEDAAEIPALPEV